MGVKTKVCRCARGSWPVDCDVTNQLWREELSRRHASLRKRQWGRTAVQDAENASFPSFFLNCDRGRIEIDHLYGHNSCCAGLQ